MGAFCHKTEQKTALKCVFQEKIRKKTLTDGKGTLPQPKTGRFKRFFAQKRPFFSRFQVCPRTQNRKIRKTYIQIRRFGSLNQKRSPFAPFYPDFFRHFRHSGSPDRQFFRKTEVPNLQFGVKNARCGAMRAIFAHFQTLSPWEKRTILQKLTLKKGFPQSFLAYWQPESYKTAPDGQIRLNDFQIRKCIFLKIFFNRTENHTPTHG